MKVLIFGGTGESGILTVQRTLAAGHDVTVYARSPEKLVIRDHRLRIVEGELNDVPAIHKSMQGQDAVISLLGPTGIGVGMPYSEGMQTIVEAMQSAGVRRLIATATPAAADPNDRFKLSFWLAVRVIELIGGTTYPDLAALGRVVRESQLDWTLVRLPWLTSKPEERPAVAGYLGDGKIRLFFLSRDKLADFLVRQLTDTQWVRKAPAISNS